MHYFYYNLFGGGANAQLSPCDTANLDCRLDLTGQLFTDIVTTDPISYAKNPLPSLLRDVKYVGDVYGKPETCTAPENDSCLNDGSSLVYTVTYLKGHNFAACPLKAIVLMHAGGFGECSSYQQYLIKTLSTLFASKAFVVYNVEYRRGVDLDPREKSKYTSAQQYKAPYIAEQDIKGFFRSMIKRERNKSQFNDAWRIDTNNIFVGGTSAGAFAALNVAFYSNTMINALYAPPIASGNIQTVLGSPDVDFYYGDPDLDFYTFYQPKIKGVCSMWGAIPMPYNPYNDLSRQPEFFTDAHLVPAIEFHGYIDKTFPLIERPGFTQNVYLSPPPAMGEKDYNSTTFCIKTSSGPFSVDTNATSADVTNGSSYNVYRILTYYNIKTEIYVDCSMGHGLDANGPNYSSNFGTSATNQYQTAVYLASRIAVFFQKILHPPAYYGNTIFVDCENLSTNCDSNTNCTNRSCGSEPIIFP